MVKVTIIEAAAEEASEAAAWYESQRPGLGVEFERAVDAALDLLEEEIVPLTVWPIAVPFHRHACTTLQNLLPQKWHRHPCLCSCFSLRRRRWKLVAGG